MGYEVGYLPQYITSQRTYELYLCACANAGSPVQRSGLRVPYYTRGRIGGSWRWAGEGDEVERSGDEKRIAGVASGSGCDFPAPAAVSRAAERRSGVCESRGGDQGGEDVERPGAGLWLGSSGGLVREGLGGTADAVPGAKSGVVAGVAAGQHVSGGVGVTGGVRGPNWERNRANRDKKKRQRQVRSAQCASLSGGAGRSSVVSGEHCASGSGAGHGLEASVDLALVRENQEGFWNSCTKEVRQELIDSKARMHIAENLRKAKEAEEKVRQLESPEALLVRAMGMVTMAEQCAKKSNDSKVAGWAHTVATSYAESIAKSAPSSVPSYSSVVSGSSVTSVSVDGTKRVKPKGPCVDVAGTLTASAVGGAKCTESKVSYPKLTVRQAIDMYGLRLAESRTEADLDKIVTEAAMDDRIVGVSLKRITSMVLEKRYKFRRAVERAEVQRLGGAA